MADTKICQILDHIKQLLSAIPGALFVDDPSRVTNPSNGVVIMLEWAQERGFQRREPDICNAVDVLPVFVTIQCPRTIGQADTIWKAFSPWHQAVHAVMYADRSLGGLAGARLAGVGPGGVSYLGQQPTTSPEVPDVSRLVLAYDIGFSTAQDDLTQ